MALTDKILKKAIEEANKSSYKKRLGCVIFDKKRVLSVGHNCLGSARHLHPKYQKWENSIHAEVDAIISARRNLKGMSLLVVRLGSDNTLKMSKPCERCLSYIGETGIKRVYFSKNDSLIDEIKV